MTRKQFYNSQEWGNLVEIIKQERTTEDGIICAHCGKPIVKKYDCIAHHKIELTDANVNNPQIALNPDNIELIHFKCHNLIHQRFEAFKQKVYLIYGSPKAGKSTWVNENATEEDLIVDLEKIWQAITLGRSNRIKTNVFRIRDTLIDQIRTRTGMWRNAWVIGGYPLRTDRDRLCDLLNAEPIFIDTNEEECLQRCHNDEERDYVREWWRNYTQ